jgi:biopolymer transport protein ExbD
MNQNKWLDLTPLLDIFLILLFAVLINQNVNQQHLEKTFASETDELKVKNTELQIALDQWRKQADDGMVLMAEDRIKYEFLKDKVLILDVVLKTELNHIFLNDVPTSIYMVSQQDRREGLKSRIKQVLHEAVQKEKGGASLLLVTLDADDKIYRYAYQITLEALNEWFAEKPVPEAYLIQLQ